MTIKDIDKQTLSELIRGYEERIAELEGNRQGCEMCKKEVTILGTPSVHGWLSYILFDDEEYNSLVLKLYYKMKNMQTVSININYCPFCGRKLVQT